MTLYDEGRASRESRVREGKSGFWGSSSQDFVRLANLLFRDSARYAQGAGGNCSIYAPAGIPMLLSALRCLLIELNTGIYDLATANATVLGQLAGTSNDIKIIVDNYPVPPELRDRLELLVQVRHEIIHPAHRPAGAAGNTPPYLEPLRRAGLLQSTGRDADYIWLTQLQSHRLFKWAFETVKATVTLLLDAHGITSFVADGLKASYSEYEAPDAA